MSGYENTRRYRVAHPDACEREKRRNAARQRALVQLARAYPDAFRALYHGELEAAGLARATGAHSDGSGVRTPTRELDVDEVHDA